MSNMKGALFLIVLIIISQSSSVSGLGISVFLLTKKLLLQNSFSFKIYAIGSFVALLIINFLKSLIVLLETFSSEFIIICSFFFLIS